jgi:hypothetical protein
MKIKGIIIKCKAKDLLKSIEEQYILNLAYIHKANGGFTYTNNILEKEMNNDRIPKEIKITN